MTPLLPREVDVNQEHAGRFPTPERDFPPGPVKRMLRNAYLAAGFPCPICQHSKRATNLYIDPQHLSPCAYSVCLNCGHCEPV